MSAENSLTKPERKEVLGNCQAEVHVPRYYDEHGHPIPHMADTVDHLTPKKIARELGWRSEDFKSENARVPMHAECHALKDASTPARIALIRKIKGSKQPLDLEAYRCIRDVFDAVDVDPVNRNGNGSHGETIIETDLLE